MPSEILRDVLRQDDAAGRARRRWSLFPLSIAVHAVGALAYLIIPLAAEVTPPSPAPLWASRHWVMPLASPPSQPLPRTTQTTVQSRVSAAPLSAPRTIEPEDLPPVAGIPIADGAIDLPVSSSVHVPEAAILNRPVERVSDPPPAPVTHGPVRVGGAVRAPRRLEAIAPIYPPIAMSARVEGVVRLEALIDEQGRVGSVRVLRSVPLLDTAAVDAVRTWRYTPTLLNGVPVPVLMTVTVSFRLQH